MCLDRPTIRRRAFRSPIMAARTAASASGVSSHPSTKCQRRATNSATSSRHGNGAGGVTDSGLMGNAAREHDRQAPVLAFRQRTPTLGHWMEIENPRFPTIYTALPTTRTRNACVSSGQRAPDRLARLSSTFFWDIWDHSSRRTPGSIDSLKSRSSAESIFAGDAGHPPTDVTGGKMTSMITTIERRKANLKVNERVRDLTRSVVLRRTTWQRAILRSCNCASLLGRGGYDGFTTSAQRAATRPSPFARSCGTLSTICVNNSRDRGLHASGSVAAEASSATRAPLHGTLFMSVPRRLTSLRFDRWIANSAAE